MKFCRIILSIYQCIIIAFAVFFIIMTISSLLSGAGNIHIGNLLLAGLIIVPTMILCLCNVLKILFCRFGLFCKWNSLNQISIVFTILFTIFFMYLLIFETTHNQGGSCNKALTTNSLSAGQMAPDFEAKDQFGQLVLLSELKGKIVLLDFWGTWCGSCTTKLPYTQKVYDKYKNKELVVVGIHSVFNANNVNTFIAENNYTFPTIIDPGHIAKDYGVNAWPTYYLIDKKGYIVWGPEVKAPSKYSINRFLKKES